jgi:hypothetical protein
MSIYYDSCNYYLSDSVKYCEYQSDAETWKSFENVKFSMFHSDTAREEILSRLSGEMKSLSSSIRFGPEKSD